MAYKTKFDGNTDTTITLGKDGAPKQVEGFFLGTKETPDTGYGPGKLHIFKTEAGNVGVWGKTNLNRLLTTDIVGQCCLVEFTGMIQPKKKGRSPSYGFKVQHDPDNTIDTSGVNLNHQMDNADDLSDDSELDDSVDAGEEEEYTPPARTVAAKTPATVPNNAARARVEALLQKNKR